MRGGRAGSPGVGSLREYSLEVKWHDHRAGEKALHREITKLPAGKLRLGIREIPDVWRKQFQEHLQMALTNAAFHTTDAELRTFWEKMSAEIPEGSP